MAARVGALAIALVLGLVSAAHAAGDPPGCTQAVAYDPSIPTFAQVAAANPGFSTNNGQSITTLGGFQTGTNNRHPSADLFVYQQAIADATAANARVRVVTKSLGTTFGGRTFTIAVAGTPAHIASLDTDAGFWRGVRAGSISEATAGATLASSAAPPAFGWITSSSHGSEPAGGEAAMRLLYELAARTDCANQKRLANLNVFIDPARNPDGRDTNTRTTAFAFDANRDLAFQTQDVNGPSLDAINQYPGLVFVDAHQQPAGLFIPPADDPALHELSDFATDTLQNTIGPALQERFNDQGLQYRSYNAYDRFSAGAADTSASLFMGAAGVVLDRGSSENYGKQVYDLYLGMETTLSVVSKRKDQLAKRWVSQWTEAATQGAACQLQDNRLTSPLHLPPSGAITQQPGHGICGYYFKAGRNAGDVARVIELLRARDVKVYKLTGAVAVTGSHDFGETGTKAQTLATGTYYIPAGQTMKHWLHATLEEQPFVAFPYVSDVTSWSFPQLFGLGGAGQLQSPLPAGAQLTPLTGPTELGGVTNAAGPVLAFATDSSKALGLVTQLLDGGATVARGGQAFDAGGLHFPTGTALVDGATLGAMDLQAMSASAQTPVLGLPAYPVPRYALSVPKIALYTGSTTSPTNPVFPGSGNGHCTSAAYCEMVFALAKQLNVPVSRIVPFTSTDLAAGNLAAQGFTAIVNPGFTIAAGAGATALQSYVNSGGNYVGYNNGGATSLRNAGITTLNTSATNVAPFTTHCADNADPAAAGSLTTSGTALTATFDVTDPLAWGFDEGGYIYRDASTNSVFDPLTVGTATAAVSYADPLVAFGYECNATVAGALPGRPYAVHQPFGAGHATIIGSDVFFRGWTAGAQRLVMNGVLYPTGGAVVPLTTAQLARRPVRDRPVIASHDPRTDITVVVRASQANALRAIVRQAKLPRTLRSRYTRHGRRVTLTLRGAYREPELRPAWAWRIITGMTRRQLTPIAHRI